MGITDILKQAGYKPEKSTVGDKPIMKGVFKCLFVDWAREEDKGYGEQVSGQFKIIETLAGSDSRSTFPEFRGYYKTSVEAISSKRNGLAKLLNGFFSVGKNVDTSSDEALADSLNDLKGSAEVYIKGYDEKPRKKEGDAWVDDPDGALRQGFTFLTEKNALKEAEKMKKKQGHPL
jgi:hypothetical protein